MTLKDIAILRMHNQGIVGQKFKKPEDVVRHLGAMQAQDYLGALWAIGLRMGGSSEPAIEKALAQGKIVRTWPMRSTLHFVAAEDARWLLALLAPRVLAAYTYRMNYHGINESVYAKASKIFIKALKGRRQLTRQELYQALEKDGISSKNSLGLHIIGRLALEQLVCFGPRKGKQQTLVLFDEWLPKSKKLSREESLRELVIRYFTSHGPAQIKDLNWWAGISMKDIRQGIELAGSKLKKEEVQGKIYYMSSRLNIKEPARSGKAYLLPPFDEFLVAYRDRDACLEKIHAQHINPGANGIFAPIIVINGQVVGTWRRAVTRQGLLVTPKPFIKLSPEDNKAIEVAVGEYKRFME